MDDVSQEVLCVKLLVVGGDSAVERQLRRLSQETAPAIGGAHSEPATKGRFSPVALARQPHQRALSDFIVQTARGASRSSIRRERFYRENTIRLDASGHSVYPDCSFELVRKDAGCLPLE